ncbi:general transcription factor 3c polypeptide 5 [Anaeramoeba ignava]|uniref:General transcription factor 3c polypeptide 5 n=1 Tax=Anaeramoeba ignava TaxID=1746090 RepID=A0A9Q0LHW4_ANAIG|nr:general transcription factor 3c polypeptide 5 [Anaeramoeba ignava]
MNEKKIPHKKFFCIEFPGYVKDTEKALKMLGGISRIKKYAIEGNSTDSFTIKIIPNATPLFGERLTSNNLFLKVSKQKISQSFSFEPEIIGSIPESVYFKGMFDFQFIQPEFFKKDQILKKFNENSENLFLQPKRIDSHDIPVDYAFKENPFFQFFKNQDGEFELKSKKTKKVTQILFKEPIPPILPFDPKNDIEKKIHNLFERRPVWSRRALELILKKPITNFKNTLELCAFNYKTGPWRSLWVRRGVNLLENKSNAIYQSLDFRISRISSKENTNNKQTQPIRFQKRKEIDKNQNEVIYDFDIAKLLKLPKKRQFIYQICDVIEGVKSIREFYQKIVLNENCEEKSGFLKANDILKIKKLMREQVEKLQKNQNQNQIENQNQNQNQNENENQIEIEIENENQIEIENENQNEIENQNQNQIEIENQNQNQIENQNQNQNQNQIQNENENQIENQNQNQIEIENQNQIQNKKNQTLSQIENEIEIEMEEENKVKESKEEQIRTQNLNFDSQNISESNSNSNSISDSNSNSISNSNSESESDSN